MKNFFKAIVDWIKSRLIPRSRHPSRNELEENASSLTFICPGCGFHLQLPGTPVVEASNQSRPKGTSGHLRHARLLPVTTDQISVLEGPLNMVPRTHHVILPPAIEQVTTFEEPLNSVPYFLPTTPLPEVQSFHFERNQRSQFKFPHRSQAPSHLLHTKIYNDENAPGTNSDTFPQRPI